MAMPSYTRKLSILANSSLSSSNSNFPYQIDLSNKLATDSKFKAAITSASNIAIYDPVADLLRPRIVSLDLDNNKLFISFDGSSQTTADKEFIVLAGPEINEVNSSQAFSLAGFIHQLCFDEFTAASTTTDCVGGNIWTINSPATLGNAGKIGNGLTLTSSGNAIASSGLIGTGDYYIEFIFKVNTVGLNQTFIAHAGSGISIILNENKTIQIYSQGTGACAASTVLINDTNFHHIGILRRESGLTDIYIDGTKAGTNMGSGTPIDATKPTKIGLYGASVYPLSGMIDNIGWCDSVKDFDFYTTRYNMLMSPETFWTIGNSSGQTSNKPMINYYNPLLRKFYINKINNTRKALKRYGMNV